MKPLSPPPDTSTALVAAGPDALPATAERVRSRLLQRVQASALSHREYRTLRREQHRWAPSAPGQRQQCLRNDAQFEVSLLQLDPGAVLIAPLWPHAGVELLVVRGRLAQGTGLAGPESYLTLDSGVPLPRWRAVEPSIVYLRSRRSQAPALPALEQHWWMLAARQSAQLRPGAWVQRGPGVQVMPLCGDARVTSTLVRFEPGGRVPDHHHALDEDCLVLEGEMFLGDILLRALDYQLAPAGGTHVNEMSDVGACFFFHGALDPVLLRP